MGKRHKRVQEGTNIARVYHIGCIVILVVSWRMSWIFRDSGNSDGEEERKKKNRRRGIEIKRCRIGAIEILVGEEEKGRDT